MVKDSPSRRPKERPPEPGHRERSRYLLPALLVGLALLPGLPALRGEFIGDDRIIIQGNPALRDPAGILRLFTQTYWGPGVKAGLYRPMTTASYAVDRLVWGADPDGAPSPFGVHLGNLILNAAVTLLLFAWLRRRWGQDSGPFWAAALFAVHPANSEAVQHLVGRADVLMTVFCLVAFLLLETPGRRARWLSAAAFLAALLSKEMAAALPLLLLVDAWARRKRSRAGEALRRRLPDLAAWLGALAIYVLARGFVIGASQDPPRGWGFYTPSQDLAFIDPRPGEVLLTMTHVFGEYLRLLVAPLSLSADYSGFPHAMTLTAPVLISAAALLALVGLVVMAAGRGRREPAFWLGWGALALFPVSNLVVMTGIVMAERVLYLPSVAMAAAFGAGAAWIAARGRYAAVVPATVVALGAVITARRAPVWLDQPRLNEETLAHGRYAGDLTQAWVAFDLLKADEERHDPALLERALPLAQASVATRPSLQNIQYLAEILLRLGRHEESLHWWKTLLHYRPDNAPIRGQVLEILDVLCDQAEARGDRAAALTRTREALEIAVLPADRAPWEERLERLSTGIRPPPG